MDDGAATIRAALARGEVLILDGGLSNALEDRVHDLSDPLWTARLLRDAPGEIQAVHEAYFRAGARVATTGSYQASVRGLMDAGAGAEQAGELIARSVRLARRAREAVDGDQVTRWVAGSVGPYGAYLADGSEYRGRYGLSAARLRDFHLPRIEVLLDSGVDLLALETIPDLDEALVLLQIVAELDAPAWLSYTVAGSRTRAGQPLSEAFAAAAGVPQLVAAGVNCCAPADVAEAVAAATAATGRAGIAYPNSGERWDAATRAWAGEAAFAVSAATAWVDRGARLVGGCCRVGPSTIRQLGRALSTFSRTT